MEKTILITDKEQEWDALVELEDKGVTWVSTGRKATGFTPGCSMFGNPKGYPYYLEVVNNRVGWKINK